MTYDDVGGTEIGAAEEASSERATGAPVMPFASRTSATTTALMRAMDRLEFVVDVETRALETHHDIDLDESNRRKSQILLELSRLMKVVDQQPLEHGVIDRMGGVRHKLSRNHAVLEIHLRAMGEISEMVAASLRAEESDGTYTSAGHLQGPAR